MFWACNRGNWFNILDCDGCFIGTKNMSKIIKIRGCEDCPFIKFTCDFYNCEFLNMECPHEDKKFLDDCPIPDLPKKKDTHVISGMSNLYNSGWNACLAKIKECSRK